MHVSVLKIKYCMLGKHLNHERCNGHRSDIQNDPGRCALLKHFHDHGCDLQKDLHVSILEQEVFGSLEYREF